VKARSTKVQDAGCGPQTSIIESRNLAASIFVASGSSSIAIRNVGLQYEAAATNGAAILLSGASDVRIADVVIENAWVGVYISDASTDVYCKRVRITSATDAYAGIMATGGATGSNKNLHFVDCVLLGPSSGAYGYWFENASQVFMASCTSLGFDRALLIYPSFSTSSGAYDLWFVNCLWDANNQANSAAAFVGEGSAGIKNVSFTNCTSANADLPFGIVGTSGAPCSGVLLTDCTVRGNQQQGILISGSDHVQVVGCSIYGNSRAGVGSYDGVDIESASDVVVANCLINATGQEYGGLHQAYSINVTGSTNVNVNGCDVSGHTESSAIAIDTTSGATSTIQNNIGYNPIGSVGSAHPAVPSTSGGYVQNYLGTAATIYIDGTATNIWISENTTFSASNKIIVPPASGDPIRLAPGQFLQITYSTKPSWQWFLD
jgi:hypothetical protein